MQIFEKSDCHQPAGRVIRTALRCEDICVGFTSVLLHTSNRIGPMQPATNDINIPLRQIRKAGQGVFDDSLRDPVRYGLGAEHVKVPGERIAYFVIKVIQGIL